MDQIIDVAKVQGCHALYVVNVSSIVDSNSNDLGNAQFDYKEMNWTFVSGAITKANIVFLGWEIKGQQGILKHQNSNSDFAVVGIVISEIAKIITSIF